LNHYWKNKERILRLQNSFDDVQHLEREFLLCQFAKNLTLNTFDFEVPEHINKHKTIGLFNKAVLDTSLVVAYFNFVNRIVLGL
jgi:hypothetical protein